MARPLEGIAVARPVTGRPVDDRLVLQVWLATRLLFAVVALAVAVTSRQGWQQVVAQWDVLHFYEIATNAYAKPQEMAFFPGLPLALRAGATLGVPMAVTGIAVATVCSYAAARALARLGGTWAAVAWLLAPTGVFTAVPYTEAPFCAAAFWAWERASQRRWGQAAVLAALACTLRVSGLFLIGALAVLALTHFAEGSGYSRRGLRLNAPRAPLPDAKPATSLTIALGWLLLPTAVLGAYVIYLYTLTGSWTAWFSAQASGWQRGFHWPWQAFKNSWDSLWSVNPAHPEWVWIFRGEMISWLVGLALTIALLVARRWAQAAWVGVQVLAFSLSYWFMSVNRAVLLWFPLWLVLAAFVAARTTGRWRVAWWLLVPLAVAVQLTWAWLFFTGRWAS